MKYGDATITRVWSDRALNRLNADMIKNLEGNPMTVMRCAIHQKNHTVFEPCPDCQTDVPEYAVPEDRRKDERRDIWGTNGPYYDADRRWISSRRANIPDSYSRLIHLGIILSAHVQEGNMKEARAVAKAFDEQLDSIKEG